MTQGRRGHQTEPIGRRTSDKTAQWRVGRIVKLADKPAGFGLPAPAKSVTEQLRYIPWQGRKMWPLSDGKVS